jgi:pimeloyl-ACP methyl ester carboxylesterase
MSAILLDGEVVHYEVIGRGRPIIFLHSWVGSWRYWIPALQTASTSYRTYALDFWGFGDTWKDNKGRYTLKEQKDLLGRFIGEMGIGRVALVGHGLGALISLIYSMDPDKGPSVDRIMAIDCPLDGNSINTRLRTATPTDLAEWLLAKTPAHEPARADAERSDPLALKTTFDNIFDFNLSIGLEKIKTPTLFVHGQNDPAITAANVANAPHNMHQIIFQQSGHFPMLDETAQFNRLLIDWLALESGESPRDLELKEEWRRRVR